MGTKKLQSVSTVPSERDIATHARVARGHVTLI